MKERKDSPRQHVTWRMAFVPLGWLASVSIASSVGKISRSTFRRRASSFTSSITGSDPYLPVPTEESQSATRTFMSPVVAHFTSVFFLSAVALFPLHQARFFAALIGGTALIGGIVSSYITIQVVRTEMTNYIQDYLAYGLLPGVGYLVLLVAAVSIYLEKDFGLNALARALLLLTTTNIRNAGSSPPSMAASS